MHICPSECPSIDCITATSPARNGALCLYAGWAHSRHLTGITQEMVADKTIAREEVAQFAARQPSPVKLPHRIVSQPVPETRPFPFPSSLIPRHGNSRQAAIASNLIWRPLHQHNTRYIRAQSSVDQPEIGNSTGAKFDSKYDRIVDTKGGRLALAPARSRISR